MRRGPVKRGKAVAEEKRQIEMSPYEIRDWANDIRSDHGKWSATADKLDGIADTIEALQQRVADLERDNEALTKHLDDCVQERLEEINAEAKAYDRDATNILTKICEGLPEFDWSDYPEGLTTQDAYDRIVEHIAALETALSPDQALRQEPGEGGGGERRKPTIHELEAILDEEDPGHVVVQPDGSMKVEPHPAQPEQAQEGEQPLYPFCTHCAWDRGKLVKIDPDCPRHGTGRQEEGK